MITLDFNRPYSTHDQGSNAQTRFMQNGKKFDINGSLLGRDGRELEHEAVETEPVIELEGIEEVVEAEPVVEPVVEPKPEVVKPKSHAKAKAKPVIEKPVEVQTEIDDLA